MHSQDQRIASLVEALEAAKQSKEQAQMATRHALMEEQERSAQYLECLKVSSIAIGKSKGEGSRSVECAYFASCNYPLLVSNHSSN